MDGIVGPRVRPAKRGNPAEALSALHPFAASDIRDALAVRFGAYLRAPPRLKALLQDHFIAGLARHAHTWRADSVTAYVASKAAAIAATTALVAKFERAAALVPLDSREGDIRALAARRAELMRMVSVLPHRTRAEARQALAARCLELGVVPPPDDPQRAGFVATEPAIARMVCPLWWRRRLRTRHVAAIGAAYRELGRVSAGRELYVSDHTVKRRREQLEANAIAAAATVIENASGRRITRAAAIAASTSNPTVRAAELMTRVHGVEDWAAENGFECLFVTMTAPSRMHRRSQSSDGRAVFDNPGFDAAWSSAARVHREYFLPMWARIRAKLQRRRVVFFGTRSVEPHHDGTPHWHLMLFVRADQRAELERVLRAYGLADSPGERGALEHRITVKAIPSGFVSSYLAKYVLQLARAEEFALSPGLRDSEPARAAAWAWENRIRQFQFFGVPEVGVWRELRRLSLDVDGPHWRLVDAPLPLREAALAVNRITWVDPSTGEVHTIKPADFGDYIRAQGGCGGRRGDRPLSVARCESPTPSRYGETFKVPYGVRCFGSRVSSDAAGEIALEAPAESILEIHRDTWRVVSFAPAPRTVKVTGPSSGAAGALDPPETVPRVLGQAPPTVPTDRLDQELERECEARRDELGRFWWWPRSAPSSRPPIDSDLAADLARDLARLGPIPA